jgi:hypothetical protein
MPSLRTRMMASLVVAVTDAIRRDDHNCHSWQLITDIPHAMPSTPPPASFLSQQDWEIGEHILHCRVVESLRSGASRYPIYRNITAPVRGQLPEAFDILATRLGWTGVPINQGTMLLDGPGLLAIVTGARKPDYAMLHFKLWAADLDTVERARGAIVDAFGPRYIHEPTFTVDWYVQRGPGELVVVAIEELADDVVVEAAYPQFPGGITRFFERFLDAPEPILVLQGPPGTGKTRLIRHMIGTLAARSDGHTHVMYTSDPHAMESDELFTKFLTTQADMFVIEDADYLLRPRSDGNLSIHRFLAVGDGIARAQGRKMIFSTNLPNVVDIDEALLRPGRCFAHVPLRLLTPAEAGKLLDSLAGADVKRAVQAGAWLTARTKRTYSVADVYRAWRDCEEEAGDPEAIEPMSSDERQVGGAYSLALT